MNRTLKTLAAAALTLGLAFGGAFGFDGGGMTTLGTGGTGCCKM